MQLMYSSVITQSHLKTSLVPFFFLTHLLIFDAFSPPQVLLRTQSSLLLKILCKHSMHIQTVNIFIYSYMHYIYILNMTFCKLWQYCHTHAHTFCPEDKIERDDCTAVNLSHRFFFFYECTTFSTLLPLFSHWTCLIPRYLQTDLKSLNLLMYRLCFKCRCTYVIKN